MRGNLEVIYIQFEKMIKEILDSIWGEESYEKERGRSALEKDKF